MQIKAETKSARHGIYALLGYTYARAYDNGFTDGLGSGLGATYWPLPGNSKLDWGLSQINLNHNFTASMIYELPFGKGKRFGSSWNDAANTMLGELEADVIEKATAGFPVFVVDSNNQSGVNFQNNGNSLNRRTRRGAPGEQSNLESVVQRRMFQRSGSRRIGNRIPDTSLRPGFRQHGFLSDQALPGCLARALRLDFRCASFHSDLTIRNSPHLARTSTLRPLSAWSTPR